MADKTQAELDAEVKAAEDKAKADAEAAKAEANKFNPEQQVKVNSLLESATERGFAAGAKKSSEKMLGLETQIEELSKKGSVKGGEGNVDLEDMKKEMADLKSREKENHERSINASLLTEINEFNVVRPKQIAELLRGHISVDETGHLTIQGEEGKLKVNAQGNPMTVKEYIGNWLEQNPHMLKAPGSPGSGSRAGEFNNKGGEKTILRADFDKLSPTDQSALALKGEIKIVDAA